ncbi:hypothetical protein SteCoe_24967 [Stentor coeruleus]|uniref:Uncharacterized protein n=1 Tax=Stentor coeruleus TaxID=5963 RepID=A0A1R2BGB8_9CILI|nr:hypothetical protein SteCoe_24967 [Stentor coeruleus]
MSFDDLEAGFKNFSGSSYNYTPKDSRACAGAMRALQERLKQLENENAELKDKIVVIEGRVNNDREKWQIRMMEEFETSKQKEELLTKRLKERDEEIIKLQNRVGQMEEHVRIKETQCRYAENEVKRNTEQYRIDIESLNLQVELLQKTLNEKQAEGKSSSLNNDKLERDKTLLEEELKQEKRINQGLQSEVKFLRENSENQRMSMQKNFETMEQELTKQNIEYSQKVKELEIKTKSFKDLNNNQTKQIEHLKKEISELLKSKKQAEERKFESVKNKTIEPLKKIPAKSQSKPTISSKSPSIPSKTIHKKEKSLPEVKELIETEDDIRKQIINYENEVEKLNQRYKSLLNLSYKDSEDLSTVRKDITKVAEDIDKKSEELYDLKKRQQQFLRAKLAI